MTSPVFISGQNSRDYLYLEQLKGGLGLTSFRCAIEEYTDYLLRDAVRSRIDSIAVTWLLRDKADDLIIAYMSMINDTIRLSVSEKEIHKLDYPFKTIPAMKIAKLAVSESSRERYKGIGSFMIETAKGFARGCNADYSACRFITVDADIEHNESVIAFYTKNGFIPNAELNNKRSKTISMRKDIWR
jgi:GNAT superfamily N-acetyltransferase